MAKATTGKKKTFRKKEKKNIPVGIVHISASFNNMAQSLQDRIERDARFASDVSHELRSPLMTLAASIEVMNNQRDDLPERARSALDLMVGDIDRFQQLVEDLLEISRFDAGVACPKVARFAAMHGLECAEFLAGIPGTMGGALAMNAGCYGSQTWDRVVVATLLTREGRLVERTPGDFDLGYRHVELRRPAAVR